LRNRWRRMQISDPKLREEIMPKNILMIGPTGVGKTEIARRLARLAKAPFIKVEATKFTEIGYVGRDVDSIIRDLADMAVKMTSQLQNMFQSLATDRVRTRKMRVKDALKIVCEEEAAKLINEDDLKGRAITSVEQNGIVFIDELDKVTRRENTMGADVSREGV